MLSHYILIDHSEDNLVEHAHSSIKHAPLYCRDTIIIVFYILETFYGWKVGMKCYDDFCTYNGNNLCYKYWDRSNEITILCCFCIHANKHCCLHLLNSCLVADIIFFLNWLKISFFFYSHVKYFMLFFIKFWCCSSCLLLTLIWLFFISRYLFPFHFLEEQRGTIIA